MSPSNDVNKKIEECTTHYFKTVDRAKLLEARKISKEIFEEKKDTVFIYMPTYNRAKFLKECSIPSILKQSHQDFTLLILGDGCNDDTEQIVTSFNDPRIFYQNIQFRSHRYPDSARNRWLAGPVFPANVALQQIPTSAKWIARIDDDEEWVTEHLDLSLKVANELNLEFVSSGNREKYLTKPHIDNLGFHAKSEYYYPGVKNDVTSPLIGCTSTFVYRAYLNCFLYNSDCWRKNHNAVNDIDLSIRMYEAGVKMGHTGLCTVISTPRDAAQDALGIEAYLKGV
jgi:glycosyltransferase involved in cell wall biosynthesis